MAEKGDLETSLSDDYYHLSTAQIHEATTNPPVTRDHTGELYEVQVPASLAVTEVFNLPNVESLRPVDESNAAFGLDTYRLNQLNSSGSDDSTACRRKVPRKVRREIWHWLAYLKQDPLTDHWLAHLRVASGASAFETFASQIAQ